MVAAVGEQVAVRAQDRVPVAHRDPWSYSEWTGSNTGSVIRRSPPTSSGTVAAPTWVTVPTPL
ncbi:hypothetical protein NI17_018095 [Thermobifida halotolerans]|uniref:Uncharacterized protein n=1 Tax=Thermobifida halotolerans TaxID=483545 RepID=A0A399FXZ6_9ACTN|nr:hypothetical protein [Thermobifida halotolerans]UOE18690.1 hypothetical protein NI17_018095 [Thermobifida halotolerans]